MALYHLDKICRREASQGGLGKVRIGGEKVFRGSVQVGEVAPAPTGDQDLFADAAGMFNQEDTLPSPACMNSTEKPRRAGAHDQNIVRQSGERGLRQLGVISYQTCPYYGFKRASLRTKSEADQLWQATAPRFSKYFWWYSSPRQKVCAGTTWVTIGFLKALCSVSRAIVAWAASSCWGE